jgi:RNA polymerase sigma-70 factor (ECF subfamily)
VSIGQARHRCETDNPDEMGRHEVQLALAESPPAPSRLDAFERLSDRCLDEAYRLAAVVLRDPVEAEDVVHDAAIIAWRKLASLRDPGRFDAWFGRIVLNLCRDRLRSQSRSRIREAALGSQMQLGRTDEFGLVADREAIARAFARLDPDLQLVVVLRFYKDMPLESMAELLDIPLGTVKSRLHKGLRRLRAELERSGWREEE